MKIAKYEVLLRFFVRSHKITGWCLPVTDFFKMVFLGYNQRFSLHELTPSRRDPLRGNSRQLAVSKNEPSRPEHTPRCENRCSTFFTSFSPLQRGFSKPPLLPRMIRQLTEERTF
ncbi:MAG: hypothetical protein EA390_03845 [Balneolaceae bacterium]|nr:MAG: hypothetical protein EA390_03845 [Balneolaceae bacterium]